MNSMKLISSIKAIMENSKNKLALTFYEKIVKNIYDFGL